MVFEPASTSSVSKLWLSSVNVNQSTCKKNHTSKDLLSPRLEENTETKPKKIVSLIVTPISNSSHFGGCPRAGSQLRLQPYKWKSVFAV